MKQKDDSAIVLNNDIAAAQEDYIDLHCKNCYKSLAKLNFVGACIDLRCHRCGGVNSVSYETDQQIFLTDRTGKILFVNDLVEKITGYNVNEVLGKTPAIWGRQMPQKFYQKLWKDISENKKAVTFRITNRRKNGQLYKARVSIFPILDEKNKISNFLGMQTFIKNIGTTED